MFSEATRGFNTSPDKTHAANLIENRGDSGEFPESENLGATPAPFPFRREKIPEDRLSHADR